MTPIGVGQASDGYIYQSDTGFLNGNAWGSNVVVASVDAPLYHSERNAKDFGQVNYEFPVEVGKEYKVTLKFAEIWSGLTSSSVGKRVFDIKIEDKLEFLDVDILKEVGFAAPYDLDYSYVAEDVTLDIVLVNKIQNAKISAIVIEELQCIQSDPTSSPIRGPSRVPSSGPDMSSPMKSHTTVPTTGPVTGSPTSSPVTLQPIDSTITNSPTQSPETTSPVPDSPTNPGPVTGSPMKSLVTNAPTRSPVTGSPTRTPMTTQSPTHIPTFSPTASSSLELVLVGDNGSPAAAFPLSNCQGDCDVDGDCQVRQYLRSSFNCARSYISCRILTRHSLLQIQIIIQEPLLCYLRFQAESVPGCSGTGVSGDDYCAYRPANYLFYVGDGLDPGSLGLCEGDCDADIDCAVGLICDQRSGVTPVPGCDGTGRQGSDYCRLSNTLGSTMAPTTSSPVANQPPTAGPTHNPSLPTDTYYGYTNEGTSICDMTGVANWQGPAPFADKSNVAIQFFAWGDTPYDYDCDSCNTCIAADGVTKEDDCTRYV